VLTGPETAEQARNALAAPRLAEALSGVDADVLADCGRFDPRSPALDVVRRADVAVLVVRPVYAELKRLVGTVPALRQVGARLAVVLIGKGAYPPAEVAEALGVEVLGTLPFDPQGAAALGGAPTTKAVLRRSPLLRQAQGLVPPLLGRLPPVTERRATPSTTPARGTPNVRPGPGREVLR
jgi:hypothetical protein